MSLCVVAFKLLDHAIVHVGFHVSLHTHVTVVAHVIVTVVGVVVKLAGLFHAFAIQPLNTYPLAVLHVALIVAHELYLYVHHHDTLATHAHAFNVKTYVLLANHIL